MMDSNAIEEPCDEHTIKELIDCLGDKIGMSRQQARLMLIKMGKPAAPFLIEALTSQDEHVRWGAAKALVSIEDPLAAPALVNALMDESSQIRWLAAKALIALQRSALVPLLTALELHSDSLCLKQGAHHVLHDLKKAGLLDKDTLQVLTDLNDFDNQTLVPLSALKALNSILGKNDLE